MFSLRRETDYAIQFLKKLAKERKNFLSLQTVAEQTGVSFLFLQKIARKLRLFGLVEAEQGVKGGYRLIVPKEKLTLKKVTKAMEGGCAVLSCFKNDSACCGKDKNCPIKSSRAMNKMQKELNKMMERIKIVEL